MNILVTGGAGFIGGHLVEELLNIGHKVFVIDDESATSSEKYNWFEHATNFKISILEKDRVEAIFKKENIDYVFHLAAETKIQLSIDNPQRCFETNINGTVNLLELSKKYNIKRFIYASSSSIYGLQECPNSENDSHDCLNPYAASKLCNEIIARTYTNIYGLETIGFRFFNVFGERMPSQGSYAPVVAIFNRQIKEGQNMTITGDGSQRRDFVYVKDVVSGLIAGMTTNNPIAIGKSYNIGTGENISVLEIAKLMGNRFEFIPARNGDAMETLADLTNIKNDLGWEPNTNLVDWLKNGRAL